MNLTKDECLKAIKNLNDLGEYKDGRKALLKDFYPNDFKLINQLIDEHFDNPPLKFEELEVGMWVWDNLDKEYRKISSKYTKPCLTVSLYFDCREIYTYQTEFEENRFFRKQVEE